MLPGGTVAAPKGCSSAWPYPPPTALRSTLPLCNLAKEHGGKFPGVRFLTILAACLCAVFAGFLVLEAFDGDLDIGPFGAEDFAVELHGQTAGSSQFVDALSNLDAIFCFVVAAGTYLVSRHRARSALATDHPFIPIGFNMAEPWGRT